MEQFINSRLVYSILFYILLILLLISIKPSVIFNRDGSLKHFGLDEDKTIFSLGVFTVLVAVVSFYIFCLIDIIFL
jgi:hypothetical protein